MTSSPDVGHPKGRTPMEAAVALLAIALLANKIIEFLKYVRTRDVNAAVTLFCLWVAGFLALTLAAHAAVTENLIIPQVSIPLSMMDWPSLLLLGLMLTSTGSTVYDFKKSLDNTDSAVQPPLVK